MAKFSIPIYTSRLLPMGIKILWGSQSTSDLRIFGVQKPILDVKTPKTSTSARAGLHCLLNNHQRKKCNVI